MMMADENIMIDGEAQDHGQVADPEVEILGVEIEPEVVGDISADVVPMEGEEYVLVDVDGGDAGENWQEELLANNDMDGGDMDGIAESDYYNGMENG